MAAPGVVMLAGGDSEGDIGVKTDWSYALYKKLIDNGDTTGDKKIKVVVLSLDKPSSNFMVDYLKSMGADSSYNLVVDTKKKANDPKVTEMMKDADVVFIRGGNQGRAYQLWKGTKVHEEITKLGNRGGAIGGTSSGSMSLSQYSITGGQDFDTREVLADSTSKLLNDEKSVMKSGIHDDFLNMAPGILVDTHCGIRGRVGRLMATLAKATDDYKNKKIVGVCLEEKTGIVIEKGRAKVYGTGVAHFLSETAETKKVRVPGKPLSYTNVRADALTDGWVFDIASRQPDLKSAPKGTEKLNPDIDCAFVTKHFKMKAKDTNTILATEPNFTKGFTVFDSAYSDSRIIITRDPKKGLTQTLAYDKIAKNPGNSIILLDSGSELIGLDKKNLTIKNQKKNEEAISTLILDCKNCSHTSTAPYVSLLDPGNKTLYSKGVVNMRIHVISAGDQYNIQTHEVSLAQDIKNPYKNLEDCFMDGLKQNTLSELVADESSIIRNLKCGLDKK